MYEVSEAFREAMKRPVQHFRLRGQVIVGLRSFYFTEDNILKKSFNIANQCSGNDLVEIGTVYTAELNATFLRMNLPRYSLKGARIIPRFELLTSEGYEPVPLGVFLISEANWTTWGVEVTAYDNMSKFDKKIYLNASTGMIYDFLSLACNTCGVELGMDEFEVQELPNGRESLAVYQDNDIETWRDLVSWCAQTTGTFATIDRSGKLVLRAYGTEPVDTIDDYHRYTGAKFSDFETRYTGLSVVNIAERVTQYYSLDIDDGLTYNLGQNPLIQYGLEETLTAQRRAILDAIAVIKYVPMEVDMIGSPAYDLGDVLVFSEGAADGEKLSCVTKYDWTYGGDYTVTGVGQNPALASARSKTDKDITGLLSSTNEDVIHYYDYVNAEEYHIGDEEKAEIIVFHYITTKATHIDFHAEVKYLLETTEIDDEEAAEYTENDGVLKVTYYLNEEEVTEYHPIETALDGEHLLHLLFTWQSSANVVGTFKVVLELKGGEVWIDQSAARGYIAGQGLVGDDAWDGTVRIEQEFPAIDVSVTAGGFESDVSFLFGRVVDYGPGDNIPAIDVRDLLLGGFTDAVAAISKLHRFDVKYAAGLMTYDGVITDISAGVWRLEDTSVSGTVTTPAAAVSRVLRVTSRHSGDDVAYIVSFDAGAHWWTYVDDWREPDYSQDVYGMFEGTMRSIPSAVWAEKLNGSLMVRAILVGSATLIDIQIYTEDIIS
jgi:hypothetical protein